MSMWCWALWMNIANAFGWKKKYAKTNIPNINAWHWCIRRCINSTIAIHTQSYNFVFLLKLVNGEEPDTVEIAWIVGVDIVYFRWSTEITLIWWVIWRQMNYSAAITNNLNEPRYRAESLAILIDSFTGHSPSFQAIIISEPNRRF